jgi:cytochrome c oxidase subunit 2
MCGKGHFGMRGVVIVETQEEFDRWLITKPSQYAAAHPEQAPQKTQPADTTSKPKVVAANMNK